MCALARCCAAIVALPAVAVKAGRAQVLRKEQDVAKFLRVGERIVNLDLVTDVGLSDERVVIFFASPRGEDARSWSWTGDEAKQIRAWFEKNAQDVAVDESTEAGMGFSHSYDDRMKSKTPKRRGS
jgi:hypothetical protein